jgi:hypothetical protein
MITPVMAVLAYGLGAVFLSWATARSRPQAPELWILLALAIPWLAILWAAALAPVAAARRLRRLLPGGRAASR